MDDGKGCSSLAAEREGALMTLDLLCMGRAAVDLYADQIGSTLEDAASFSKYVGGCPANIAIGASRLGLKTGILSRVGDEAMGKFVKETFIREGVDVSHLHTDKNRLTALVLLGIDPPDKFPLIFYRENCADMAISEADFSEETFNRTKALLVTGTHCSNEHIFNVTKKAVALAKSQGTKVILDIDYRPVLWGVAGHGQGEARYVNTRLVCEKLSSIYKDCDLIVGTEEEILAGTDRQELKAALECLREQTAALIVCKKGAKGSEAYPGSMHFPVKGRAFSVDVLNVLGAGDAFMSGFLSGWLNNLPVQNCLDLANANGALVVSRHGCSPAMPYKDELALLLQNEKDMERTERLHRALGQKREALPLALLAFDHRSCFERFPEDRVKQFKHLVYRAFEKVQTKQMKKGIIADDIYSKDIIKEATAKKHLLFKCIEEPNAKEFAFLEDKEASLILRTWPKEHMVKVLCQVEKNAFQKQLKKLKSLDEASKTTGHSVLIELKSENQDLIQEMIAQCYEDKVYPAWWKLPFNDDEIEQMIKKYDPFCQGVLLLGDNKPLDALAKAFGQTKAKGFAVGRSIWENAAKNWFSEHTSENQVIEEVFANFTYLIHAWEKTYGSTNRNETKKFSDAKSSHADNSASPDPVPRLPKSRTF